MPTYSLSAPCIFLLSSALLCGWLAWHALQQSRTAFARYFAALMVCSALYALGYGLEVASANLAQMKAMLRIQYIGIPFVPLAWLGLAWSYLDPRGLPGRVFFPLLSLSGFIFILFQCNDWHLLYYTSLSYSHAGGMAISVIGKGPFYWLNIIYLNLASGAGVLLLFRAWRQASPLYHHQALCLLVGSFFPWLFHLIYQLGLSPNNLDLSPFGLAASGLFFAIASLRHGILDILPMARDRVLDGLAEGVIVLDGHGLLVDFNRAAQSLFPALNDQAIGQPAYALDRMDMLARAQAHERFELSHEQQEDVRQLEVRSYPLLGRKQLPIGHAVLIQDVTEKKALLDRLQQLASFDELTGIFNRRQLLELSCREFMLAQRHGHPLSVVIIDLDHFKTINDQQGHLSGDALLKGVAHTLQQRLRSTDILGRYGGDEFIITLPRTDAVQASQLASELNRACLLEHETSLSMGVAELVDETGDFTALLQRADTALYRAKAAGRSQVVSYCAP